MTKFFPSMARKYNHLAREGGYLQVSDAPSPDLKDFEIVLGVFDGIGVQSWAVRSLTCWFFRLKIRFPRERARERTRSRNFLCWCSIKAPMECGVLFVLSYPRTYISSHGLRSGEILRTRLASMLSKLCLERA